MSGSDLNKEALEAACVAAEATYMAEREEGLAFDAAVASGIRAYLSASPPTAEVELLKRLERLLTKSSLAAAEKVSDALQMVRAALATADREGE